MLGVQFDPTLSLELNRRRHADLIAEVQHEALVRTALEHSVARAATEKRLIHVAVTNLKRTYVACLRNLQPGRESVFFAQVRADER